jgi:hypothetical protein
MRMSIYGESYFTDGAECYDELGSVLPTDLRTRRVTV